MTSAKEAGLRKSPGRFDTRRGAGEALGNDTLLRLERLRAEFDAMPLTARVMGDPLPARSALGRADYEENFPTPRKRGS